MCLELQKEYEQQDFWLLQYQKLLDAQPSELSIKSSSIDPMLGYNFLINEVVHCIPFLSKLWQSKVCNIEDITDDDLIAAGIQKQWDRAKILKSINDFVRQQQQQHHQLQSLMTTQLEPNKQIAVNQPAVPCEQQTTNLNETCNDLASECVICMEETVFSFILFISICITMTYYRSKYRLKMHCVSFSSFSLFVRFRV